MKKHKKHKKKIPVNSISQHFFTKEDIDELFDVNKMPLNPAIVKDLRDIVYGMLTKYTKSRERRNQFFVYSERNTLNYQLAMCGYAEELVYMLNNLFKTLDIPGTVKVDTDEKKIIQQLKEL